MPLILKDAQEVQFQLGKSHHLFLLNIFSHLYLIICESLSLKIAVISQDSGVYSIN